MAPATTTQTRTARRVTIHEARRHFEAGGDVLVSEHGHKLTCTVTQTTTTHNRTRTTWAELAATVKEWRGRYPNQRFYVVDPAPESPSVAEAAPSAPDVAEVSGLLATMENARKAIAALEGVYGLATVFYEAQSVLAEAEARFAELFPNPSA